MKENNQTVPDVASEDKAHDAVATNVPADELDVVAEDDIELLTGMMEKYPLTVLEKKVIGKIVSLLETRQLRRLLPKQNVGDSVFKMYSSDDEPTEFLVDRVEFDDYGWNLVSYEKFGTSEVEFVFSEKDYQTLFFDSAEEAKEHYHKA